ncbi:DUF4421 domain-containing protein [Bacteroides sp. 519]|uniref:DUF4421 domain-containing protein n=1 Tax=Bacteroides sp. 519 TaxID=2302937 RepID=UPI0013D061CE|nr:DUF4421 domain-containing protein [Bacteroides sp. 519]NDV60677.1 DUF4421 domain-containing protein [Bacteroides sp. 519]
MNNYRLKCFLFICLFISLQMYGQVDSTYIGRFRQDFSVRTYFYQKFTSLSHIIEDEKEIDYHPNNPVGIGLGVQYKNYSLSGGMTFDAFRNKKKGKTQSLDFQYHYYGRKFIADIFFQRYKGFYVEEQAEDGKKETIILHPDISLIQYGVNGQYVFNHKKFSYRAAFNQQEKQLKSTGSFQLGGGFYYNRISGDGTLVINDHNQVSGYQLSISGGYVHTFVIKKNYFVSLAFSAGVSLGTERLEDFFKSIDVIPNMYPRISLGYNGDSWSVAINAVVNRIGVSYNKDVALFVDTGRANLVIVKRFDSSPKFLQKIKFLNK